VVTDTPNHTEATISRSCKDCGTVFEITAGARAWFEAKGLALPKRCKPCRLELRKYRQMTEQYAPGSER